jgi:hypothetical protein
VYPGLSLQVNQPLIVVIIDGMAFLLIFSVRVRSLFQPRLWTLQGWQIFDILIKASFSIIVFIVVITLLDVCLKDVHFTLIDGVVLSARLEAQSHSASR